MPRAASSGDSNARNPSQKPLRQWLTRQRGQVRDGSATAKAIEYTLGRWAALIRYIDDGDLPIDNNHLENRIRPVALGRNNWLFAGSLRAGQCAAIVMSLIQSAKLNEHDPHRYLKDVMERLPTQPASRLDELLTHRWSAHSTRVKVTSRDAYISTPFDSRALHALSAAFTGNTSKWNQIEVGENASNSEQHRRYVFQEWRLK
jgi:hypothetical protein